MPRRLPHDERLAEDCPILPREVIRLAGLEALDLVIATVERRFCTSGLRLAVAREHAALDDPTGKQLPSPDVIKLPASIHLEKLECQRSVLR